MSNSKGTCWSRIHTMSAISRFLLRISCTALIVFLCAPRCYAEDESPHFKRVIENLWDQYRNTVDQTRKAIERNQKAVEEWRVQLRRAGELNREGLRQISNGNPKRAIELLTEAIKIAPIYEAFLNRGIARADDKEYDKALDDFTTALSLYPQSAEAYYLRSDAHYHKKAFHQAKADVEKALELKSDFVDALIGRGAIREELGDSAKAMDDYNQAIKLAPQDEIALRRRALLWLDRDEYKHVIDDLSGVLRVAPNDATSLARRGWSHFKLHEHDEARADLERSVELSPNDEVCLIGLATLLAACPPMHRDGRRAVDLARKGGDLDKWANPWWFDALAMAQAEAGNFEAAIESQKRAIEIEKNKQAAQDYRQRLSLYQSKKPYRLPGQKEQFGGKRK
jgi:tetratricopeptide (TPR) repeat protein